MSELIVSHVEKAGAAKRPLESDISPPEKSLPRKVTFFRTFKNRSALREWDNSWRLETFTYGRAMTHQHREIEHLAPIHAPLPPMTEDEILSMADEHYMGEAQKRCFRALLVAMGESLEARSRESAAEIAVGTPGADPVDRASAEEEHQLPMGGRVRDAAQLLQVRAALQRIDVDEFGWCVVTGEMIGVGRLLVCPTTTLCVEAQQRRETNTSRYRK